jgi:magnesium transporter
MPVGDRWIDLIDPSQEELDAHLPEDVHTRALQQLLAPAQHDDEPRPKLESHGDYIFGVLLVAVAVPDEDLVYYQEVDVVMTRHVLITVRKTPESGRAPFDPSSAMEACRHQESLGMIVFHLVDDIAERYLDLIDDLNDEIDELEENVEVWSSERVRARLSALRHDVLHIRRTLGPTRDAVREVVDNRIEFEGEEVFTHDVEVSFGGAYDKLLRATDGLDLSRDLVAGVRDYHQAKIANDQNEVMKRLAVIATVFLPLAVLTGWFGQNFSYLVNAIEPREWVFWVLGVGFEVAAAIGLFLLIKRRHWL